MATATIGTLPPFNPSADDFADWVLMFQSFLCANGLDSTKDKDKVRSKGIFLSSLGLPTFSLLGNLLSPDLPASKQLDELITVLRDHFKPPPKALAERFKFSIRKQRQGETASAFLADLRKLAVTCKFNGDDNLKEHLRDQFIFGLASAAAQKRIFTKSDNLTLEDALKVAVSQEAAESGTSTIRENSQVEVNYVPSHTKSHQGHGSGRGRGQGQGSSRGSFAPRGKHTGLKGKNGGQKQEQSKISCNGCGSQDHPRKDCPYKDVTCHGCSKKGHLRRVCQSEKKSSNTHDVAPEDGNFVSSVNQVSQGPSEDAEFAVCVIINGTPHQMEFDSGCKRSLLGESFWKESLGAPPLRPSKQVFRSFTGHTFRALGSLDVDLGYEGKVRKYTFSISKGKSLFGRDLIRLFGLNLSLISATHSVIPRMPSDPVTLSGLLKYYSDIFSPPKGNVKGFKAKVVLKEDAVPKFQKARPIPFALREKVDLELQKMEESGVIQRIDHSDWASPLVVVPKPNGRVRITGDFKNTVNSQLHVTQYPLQRVDDLLSLVSGGESFSRLDGPDAFHQMELDDASKKFLVINTHRGLFRYNVLPQGIASSPAIFQEFMDELLKGIRMTGSFMDDSITSGTSESEHLKNLKNIFQRMREANYRLSMSKCQFMQKNLDYVGFVISKNGISTSPEKVKAIQNIRKPTTVTEVKSFLGFINFYGRFVPNLADICAPLYALTRADTPFRWDRKCAQAFEEVKACLSSSPILTHHTPSLPIGISCDASPKGLGVVLFHQFPDGNEKPIAYASKVLSPAETRYSQIEREALAIVFGVKKFFQFLCGRKFHVVTDHQPLLSILGPSAQVPSFTATRLQKWALHMSQFNFTMSYRRTSDHGNADALSHHPIADRSDSDPNEVDSETESEVNLIASEAMEVLPLMAATVEKGTAKDQLLLSVMRHVSSGWPTEPFPNSDPLSKFYTHRYELSVVQRVLMWGNRVIVPTSLRKQVLNSLHESHAGIVRMKSLARQHVWWPNIDSDIKVLCKNCEFCVQRRPNPPSAPLHPWEFPEKPWQRLHIDLAGPFRNRMWLIIVDAHSKWPEIYDLGSNSTSNSVIVRIRDSICRFGLTEQIVSDNGPQFVSNEFKTFCSSNGIRPSTSSVYHPRSNGEAERFIQTFKKAIEGVLGDVNLPIQRFLFDYRTIPHATTGVAPCELLQGRALRTRLHLLRPDVRATVARSQARMKKNYDPKTRNRTFEVGQRVWVRTFSKNQPKWSSGIIRSELGPVTFQVEVDGVLLKRHADQILPAPPSEPDPTDSEDEDSENETSHGTPPFQAPPENPPDPPPRNSNTEVGSNSGRPRRNVRRPKCGSAACENHNH